MKAFLPNISLLLICILTRILSTVYYIEDPESLHFVQNLYGEDPQAEQPFYNPLFYFLVTIINFFAGNYAVAFSIIGGLALYFIIVIILRLLNVPLLSLEGMLTAFLIFFNPMIWIMSNRYTPDLTGAALAIAAVYYFVPDHYRIINVYKGWFITGLLAGLRFSYFPFLIIPGIYAYISNRKFVSPVVFFFLGVLFWVVPLIFKTGTENLSALILRQVDFFVNTSDGIRFAGDAPGRFYIFIEKIWAAGLGGFWPGRNPLTLINSAGIIFCTFFGVIILMSFDQARTKTYLYAGTFVLYLIYIFFIPNYLLLSRHVLLLIPFLLILVSYGIIYFLVNYNYMSAKIMIAVFLLCNLVLSVFLVMQHRQPTAILQVKNHIETIRGDSEVNIVSTPLVNYYLKGLNVKANFFSPEDADLLNLDAENVKNISIGYYPEIFSQKYKNLNVFYHNAYVNGTWPEIPVYEY